MFKSSFWRPVAGLICVGLAAVAALRSTPAATLTEETAPALVTVHVMPPRHDSADPAARAAMEAFRTALIEALRKAAGPALRVADSADTVDSATADYRITVVSLATSASGMRGGGERYASITGSSGGSLPPVAQYGVYWPVEVAIERDGQWVSRSLDHIIFLARGDAPPPAICSQGSLPAGPSGTMCLTSAKNVLQQADLLRLKVLLPRGMDGAFR